MSTRATLCLPEPGEHGEPVEAGKIQVEHDQIGRFEQRGLQTFRAIEPRARLMIMPLQRFGDVLGELRLIFDNQDTHLFSARSILLICNKNGGLENADYVTKLLLSMERIMCAQKMKSMNGCAQPTATRRDQNKCQPPINAPITKPILFGFAIAILCSLGAPLVRAEVSAKFRR